MYMYNSAQNWPRTQRATLLRKLLGEFRSNTDSGVIRADRGIRLVVGEFEAVIKDYEPILIPNGLMFNRDTLKEVLEEAEDVKNAILALFRDNDPDDGDELGRAIAAHQPENFEINAILSQEIRDLLPQVGTPKDEIRA